MVVHFNFGVGFEVVREQHDGHWNLIQIIYLEKQSGEKLLFASEMNFALADVPYRMTRRLHTPSSNMSLHEDFPVSQLCNI